MNRRAAAVVFMLVLRPALLSAQESVLTVSVPSAGVYKGPSTVTPIVGHVSRGTALPVSQSLGSWVKVSWPAAPDGVGYVHATMGRVEASGARPGTRTVSGALSAAAPGAASAAPIAPVAPSSPTGQILPPGPVKSTRVPHAFGIGGLVAPGTVGATARSWGNRHLGVQFRFTREAMTSAIDAGRATSTVFEPGLIYAPFDHVSDYLWFRPYVGSVASFRRQTLSVAAPPAADAGSASGLGYRVFGGSELVFASVPRFGVSVEVGYRRFPALFAGFVADRLSGSIAGHWYIK